MPAEVFMDFTDVELRPAKISERFIAYIIDTVPFTAAYVLSAIKLRSAPHPPHLGLRLAAVWVAAYFLYEWCGNALGFTPGKWLMGIRVVRKDGQPLGIGRGFVRAAGYLLSTPFCNFGFVIALFHPESKALHDLLAGSLVIESQEKNAAESTLVFAASLCLVVALFGGSFYLYRNQPTPADLEAVAKARQALMVLAQIEEQYKAAHGTYSVSIRDLAEQSGDVGTFKSAMGDIFDPNAFQFQADSSHYRITARALDRSEQSITVQGPPPSFAP